MNAYATVVAAKAMKSAVTTLVMLVVFVTACAAAIAMGGDDSAVQLVAVITAWTAPLLALCSTGATIHHLSNLKKA